MALGAAKLSVGRVGRGAGRGVAGTVGRPAVAPMGHGVIASSAAPAEGLFRAPGPGGVVEAVAVGHVPGRV